MGIYKKERDLDQLPNPASSNKTEGDKSEIGIEPNRLQKAAQWARLE